jgi:hypothetical protein
MQKEDFDKLSPSDLHTRILLILNNIKNTSTTQQMKERANFMLVGINQYGITNNPDTKGSIEYYTYEKSLELIHMARSAERLNTQNLEHVEYRSNMKKFKPDALRIRVLNRAARQTEKERRDRHSSPLHFKKFDSNIL